MTVYADLLFLINFAFDTELMMILLKLSSKKIPPFRLFLSACLGGLEGVFVFIPYFRILASPPSRLIVAFLMTAIVMNPVTLKQCIKYWLLFLGCSFVFSGIINFFSIKTYWGLLLLVPVYILLCLIKNTASKKTLPAKLYYNSKCIEEYGFLDSGNRMTYFGTPVILANEKIFRRLFGDGFTLSAVCEWVDSKDLCIVPYQSLGKSGSIVGVRLSCAEINGRIYDDIILGCFSDSFSDDLILNGIMI